jgi:nitrogenase iron protein NifH
MRQIAFYGKGGIGKSTIASNISASFAKSGLRIAHIGCDPKHDSTRNILGDKKIMTILDKITDNASSVNDLREIITKGYLDIDCIEAGGPEPGVGCAGRGIVLATDILRKLGFYSSDYDIVIYDVLGDVVCGGFAVPIRDSYADEVFIVTSGEFLSLYAANNISKAILRYSLRGKTRLAGVIANLRGIENEIAMIEDFAARIGSSVVGVIPRDNIVSQAESRKQTVIEYSEDSMISKSFMELSKKIIENKHHIIPKPLKDNELEELFRKNLSN